jgi:osmoprotectant transport system substrate-binding protein
LSPANRRRAVHRAGWARRAGAALAVGAIALFLPMAPTSAQTVSIRMASKNFPGAQVLSQLYGQALASQGAHVTFADAVGATEVVFPALQAGTFDAYADYQGTLLTYLGGFPTSSSAKTHAALLDKLRGTGLTVSDAAPAVDVNGFYVTRRTAKKYRLSKVSDLRRVAPRLKIGAPPECTSRPLCLGDASRRVYGLEFGDVVPIDPNGPETQRSLRRGDVDVAVLFTGSSVIPADAVLLRDDKGLQPADNPVLVVRESMASPDTLRVANKVSAAITTTAYNAMSLAVSREQQDPTEVAARFLDEHSLP